MSNEEVETEKAARDQIVSIIETFCAAAKQIRDEYVKGTYLWPTQRPGMTKEEMKDARMAQERIIYIYIYIFSLKWTRQHGQCATITLGA